MITNDLVLQHIENSIDKVRVILTKAAERIEAIKPGDKIPATQLANDLAKDYDTTGPALYPLLKMMINKDYPGIEVRRGAHGGCYRPLPAIKSVVVDANKPADTVATIVMDPKS